MACIGRCGAYSSRPQFCKDYPRITDFIPPGCTYYFHNGKRMGSCQPESCQENNCCSYPRENGDPEAKSLDSLAGGLPCKHLKWEETNDMEKDADGFEITNFQEKTASLIAEVLHNVR